MANRNTLHKDKLAAFKAFLDQQGIAYRDGKGSYQALQVLTEKHGWQAIYERNNMPEHYTVNDKLYPLVRKFVNQPKGEDSAYQDGYNAGFRHGRQAADKLKKTD